MNATEMMWAAQQAAIARVAADTRTVAEVLADTLHRVKLAGEHWYRGAVIDRRPTVPNPHVVTVGEVPDDHDFIALLRGLAAILKDAERFFERRDADLRWRGR